MSVSPSVVPDSFDPTIDFCALARAADRVLLVEGDAFVADIIERILMQLGMRVVRATNRNEGAKLFQIHHNELGLIMLNAGAECLGGADLFRTIRQEAPDLPVILTGRLMSESADALTAAGPTACLSKPFFASEVEELVSELVGSTMRT